MHSVNWQVNEGLQHIFRQWYFNHCMYFGALISGSKSPVESLINLRIQSSYKEMKLL